MVLLKPSEPTKSKDSICEWGITQLSNLYYFNFQLSEIEWIPYLAMP